MSDQANKTDAALESTLQVIAQRLSTAALIVLATVLTAVLQSGPGVIKVIGTVSGLFLAIVVVQAYRSAFARQRWSFAIFCFIMIGCEVGSVDVRMLDAMLLGVYGVIISCIVSFSVYLVLTNTSLSAMWDKVTGGSVQPAAEQRSDAE